MPIIITTPYIVPPPEIIGLFYKDTNTSNINIAWLNIGSNFGEILNIQINPFSTTTVGTDVTYIPSTDRYGTAYQDIEGSGKQIRYREYVRTTGAVFQTTLITPVSGGGGFNQSWRGIMFNTSENRMYYATTRSGAKTVEYLPYPVTDSSTLSFHQLESPQAGAYDPDNGSLWFAVGTGALLINKTITGSPIGGVLASFSTGQSGTGGGVIVKNEKVYHIPTASPVVLREFSKTGTILRTSGNLNGPIAIGSGAVGLVDWPNNFLPF